MSSHTRVLLYTSWWSFSKQDFNVVSNTTYSKTRDYNQSFAYQQLGPFDHKYKSKSAKVCPFRTLLSLGCQKRRYFWSQL